MSNRAAGNSDREARRLEVWKLLHKVNDEKSVRTDAVSVLACAERAYKLATRPPAIIGPLRWVPGYRLAHVLLRSSDPDLSRVNTLFEEVSAFPPLSVVAQIYRVAVLERLLSLASTEGRREALMRAQKDAFDGAKNGLGRSEVADADGEGALGDRLQREVFNMVELSAYFTGLPYDDLKGRGARLDYAVERGDWVIVGPEPETSHVHFSEAAAKQELEARAEQSTGGEVFFRLGPNENVWSVPRGQPYSHCPKAQLKILALLCADRPIESVGALQERILAPQQTDAVFRQHKLRLKRGLKQLLGRSIDPPFEERGGSGGLRLSSDLVVYGAVHVPLIL